MAEMEIVGKSVVGTWPDVQAELTVAVQDGDRITTRVIRLVEPQHLDEAVLKAHIEDLLLNDRALAKAVDELPREKKPVGDTGFFWQVTDAQLMGHPTALELRVIIQVTGPAHFQFDWTLQKAVEVEQLPQRVENALLQCKEFMAKFAELRTGVALTLDKVV